MPFFATGLALMLFAGLETPAPTVCGKALSPGALAVWRRSGGEDGPLGCASHGEQPGGRSPQGTTALVVAFDGRGEIVRHADGPRRGQAYMVSGCFYRLHMQWGGSAGRLGLPIAEVENDADGDSQRFEGGRLVRTRAPDACTRAEDPEPAAAPSAPVPTAALIPFESPDGGGRLGVATERSKAQLLALGWKAGEAHGAIDAAARPGDLQLGLFADDQDIPQMVAAAPESRAEAMERGWRFAAAEGWIAATPGPGAEPIELHRNSAGVARLTVGAAEAVAAEAAGYGFVRVEGWTTAP